MTSTTSMISMTSRIPPPLLALATALLLTVPAAAGEPAPSAQPEPVPGHVLLAADDLDALRARLERSIFRAEASHVPPEPYAQVPLVYDGAVVAVRTPEGELAFLTAAAWLSSAERVVLLDPERSDEPLALGIERLDTRLDLALLRLADADAAEHYVPLELAELTPMVTYSLLSPGTPYEQLVTLSVAPLDEEDTGEQGPLYWATTLSASNGYPVVDAEARLVAVHTRRSLVNGRGLAVGFPVIAEFFVPAPERAPARAPDRGLDTTLPLTRTQQQAASDDSAPFRYRFGSGTTPATARSGR